jgi:hypothetical protein
MSPGECRVLAFGDSLTEGYHSGGHRFDPYSTHLGALVAGLAVAVPAATEPTTRAGKGRERRPARVVHLPQGNRMSVPGAWGYCLPLCVCIYLSIMYFARTLG